MIRVLIADDHKVVRQGLRFLLSSEPGIEVAGEAADGAAALDAIRALAPDVVLLDLLLPRVDGLGVLAAMQADGLSAAVLVLTSSADDQHLVQALRAGALSYLPKTAGVDQVIEAVRAAARGESVLQPAATARMLRELRHAAADPLAAELYEDWMYTPQAATAIASEGEYSAVLADAGPAGMPRLSAIPVFPYIPLSGIPAADGNAISQAQRVYG